ncbi:MAG: FKBP-type peptidyl-prolyl cis-trans isomerase [Bacteroidota bacterium]
MKPTSRERKSTETGGDRPGWSPWVNCTLFLVIGFILSLNACQESPRPVQSTDHMQMTDDTVMKYNHQVVREESQEIDDFVMRHHWNMQVSQTGLRYMIYKQGSGALPKRGEIVAIKYRVSLINGDLVYNPDTLKPFEFETGKAAVPNGLEEGVLLLKTGDHAKFILPSHLAFGLLGDMDKIKSREILVYDVELYQIKPGRK